MALALKTAIMGDSTTVTAAKAEDVKVAIRIPNNMEVDVSELKRLASSIEKLLKPEVQEEVCHRCHPRSFMRRGE